MKFRNIFHTHKWGLYCISYFENIRGEACDAWYVFNCQKCKKQKIVKTKGVDKFQTPFERIGCENNE